MCERLKKLRGFIWVTQRLGTSAMRKQPAAIVAVGESGVDPRPGSIRAELDASDSVAGADAGAKIVSAAAVSCTGSASGGAAGFTLLVAAVGATDAQLLGECQDALELLDVPRPVDSLPSRHHVKGLPSYASSVPLMLAYFWSKRHM